MKKYEVEIVSETKLTVTTHIFVEAKNAEAAKRKALKLNKCKHDFKIKKTKVICFAEPK